MSIGVFIAGRLNSERLPRKLVLPVGTACLWDIACRKLDKMPEKYNKYVLAESGELLDIARKYSNVEIIERDKDTALVDSPLSYIFKELKSVPDKHLMFLNPCLSFITIHTILYALELFEDSKADYGTSVKPFQNWLFDEKGYPLTGINYRCLSTKEITPVWQAAHCFHIFNRKKFFTDGMMLKTGHILIPVPEDETLDVDTYEDYEFARWKHEVCNRY